MSSHLYLRRRAISPMELNLNVFFLYEWNKSENFSTTIGRLPVNSQLGPRRMAERPFQGS